MSLEVTVVITENIDGTEGAESVSFDIDGTTYEIDLATQNRVRLEQTLAPFIAAGRKVRPAASSRSRPGRTADDRATVRLWAGRKGCRYPNAAGSAPRSSDNTRQSTN